MKSVAALILNYNDSETTIKLVQTIRSYDSLEKIVVVDNCSTDNSLDELRKIESDRVIVIQTDHNGGYGAGNNAGFKYIYENLHCKYTLLANPDVVITDECIDKLVNVLENTPSFCMVAPVQKLHSANGKMVPNWRLGNIRESILSTSIFLSRVFHINLAYDYGKHEKEELAECDVIQGALYLANTAVMYNDAHYDEELFLYNEEECVAQKIRNAGYKSGVLLSDIYVHNHSVSINKSINSAIKRKKIMLNSRRVYIDKYLQPHKGDRILMNVVFSLALVESLVLQAIRR